MERNWLYREIERWRERLTEQMWKIITEKEGKRQSKNECLCICDCMFVCNQMNICVTCVCVGGGDIYKCACVCDCVWMYVYMCVCMVHSVCVCTWMLDLSQLRHFHCRTSSDHTSCPSQKKRKEKGRKNEEKVIQERMRGRVNKRRKGKNEGRKKDRNEEKERKS